MAEMQLSEPEMDLIPEPRLRQMIPDGVDINFNQLNMFSFPRKNQEPISGVMVYATNFNPPFGCYRLKKSEYLRVMHNQTDLRAEDAIYDGEMDAATFAFAKQLPVVSCCVVVWWKRLLSLTRRYLLSCLVFCVV